MKLDHTVIFGGNSLPNFTGALCSALEMPLGDATVSAFSDGEEWIDVHQSVAGKHVVIVQSTNAPSARHMMELRLLADACRRADAKDVTAVIPYFGYARQDRVPRRRRAPISAALMMRDLNTAGITRLVTMELHAAQIAGSFTGPVRHLYASGVLQQALVERYQLHQPVIVAPDAGGVPLATVFAERLGAGVAVINKFRAGPNESQVKGFTGDVKDRDAVLVDDMIDTAGTITKAATHIRRLGARRVFVLATHPVLSGPAIDRIADSCIDRMFVTDTIPLTERAAQCPKIEVVTVVPLFAQAIRRLHTNGSIRELDT